MKKWKIGCLVVVAVAVCLVVIIGGVYLWGLWRMDKAEHVISNYLQKKYHREFVVTNGKYIWATGTYTFDASPKDDPEFTFPVFIGLKLSPNGISDMYRVVREGREAKLLIKPYVDAISKNNICSANFGPDMHPRDPEWKIIMSEMRKNNLTPLQAVQEYPGKIYLNTSISYALDVTDKNKDEIFKKVFNLIEFLKKSGFGYMEIGIGFYPKSAFYGKTIKEAYNDNSKNFKNDNFRKLIYRINIKTENIKNIKTWNDIREFSDIKISGESGKWVKDNHSIANTSNQ